MVEDKDIYDFVIVGTSPIAITEAIYLQAQGNKVLLIDAASKCGGAWKTVNYNSIPEIEIGCHIWDVEKRVTNFLQKFYGLDLIELNPKPMIYYKGFSIPYDWKVNLSTTKIIFKRIIRLKFTLLMKELKSPRYRFSILPSKYVYPRGGAKELISKIEKKVQEFNLNIRLSTAIESIEVMKNSITLNTSNNGIKTKNLITTSLTHLTKITIENKLRETPKANKFNFIHVHLLLEGRSEKEISYIRWMNHPVIHRISDMTDQVRGEIEPNQKIYAVGVHSSFFEGKHIEEIVSQIDSNLRSKKLISKNQRIIAYDANTYSSAYSSTVFFRSLQKELDGRITLLHSTNFTLSFYERINQYEKLLK